MQTQRAAVSAAWAPLRRCEMLPDLSVHRAFVVQSLPLLGMTLLVAAGCC